MDNTNTSLPSQPLDSARGKPSSPEQATESVKPSLEPEVVSELFSEKPVLESAEKPEQAQIEAVQEGITRSIIADDQSDNQVQPVADQNNQVVAAAADLPQPIVDKPTDIKEEPRTLSQLGAEVKALEDARDPEGEELILDDAREEHDKSQNQVR